MLLKPNIAANRRRPALIRRLPTSVLLALLALASTASVLAQPLLRQDAYVTIIIDDIGVNYDKGRRAVDLPGQVTCAFLPHRPYVNELAKRAHRQYKDVMLHAPMSNSRNLPLGPGALTRDMSQWQIQQTLQAAIRSVPHAIAVNNHMGSELTRLRQPMRWVMDTVAQHELFFVDSRTTAASVVYPEARAAGLDVMVRDVFLDHEQEESAIRRQFEQMVNIAQERGYAIGIGHPYPETMTVLEQELPRLSRQGVHLVNISDMLALKKYRDVLVVTLNKRRTL